MAEFKSAFMGGYNKKSVDEYVTKLESENETLKKALDLAEHNALKADKYQTETSKLKNETAKLKAVVADLRKQLEESEQSNSDYISNIGQIFYSAYESGAKITDDAKAGSQEFLQKIESVSAEAKAEAQRSINAYNLINTDVKALLANLTKEINAVSANTDAMIKKATLIAESMDDIQNIKSVNADKAKVVAEEYKEFFDSFSTNAKRKPIQPKVEVAEPVVTTVAAEPIIAQEPESIVEFPVYEEPIQAVAEEKEETVQPTSQADGQDRNAILRDMLKRVQSNSNNE